MGMKMKKWIWNPKVKDSGLIECIPQKGLCPNNCEDCLPGGTPVLTADYLWKPIKDIKVGDELIGFNEPNDKMDNKRAKLFQIAIVEGTKSRVAKTFTIVTAKGELRCTENHPLFSGTKWFTVSDFYKKRSKKIGSCRSKIRFISSPVCFYESKEYKAGYIWGLLDGDGTCGESIQIQKGKPSPNRWISLRMTEFEPIQFYIEIGRAHV